MLKHSLPRLAGERLLVRLFLTVTSHFLCGDIRNLVFVLCRVFRFFSIKHLLIFTPGISLSADSDQRGAALWKPATLWKRVDGNFKLSIFSQAASLLPYIYIFCRKFPQKIVNIHYIPPKSTFYNFPT